MNTCPLMRHPVSSHCLTANCMYHLRAFLHVYVTACNVFQLFDTMLFYGRTVIYTELNVNFSLANTVGSIHHI